MKKRFSDRYIFLIILSIAIFLRFYKLDELFGFSGELGDNLLDVKYAIQSGIIPLIGPPTSHPWLYFGPMFYWILIPFLLIFKYDPIAISYLGAISGIILVWVNWWTIIKVFDRKTAIISTYLIAISSYLIQFARTGRFMYWVIVLFYPLLYLVSKTKSQYSSKFLSIGLVVGVMLNFHITAIVLLPAIIWYFFKKKLFGISGFLKMLVGIMIPLTPFFIYDLKNRFVMSIKLMLWIPYRVLGFIGLIPKNNLTDQVAIDTGSSLIDYLAVVFFQGNFPIKVLFSLITVLGILFLYKKGRSIHKYLIYSLIFSVFAFTIHSNPPIHYYVPVFAIPVIAVSYMLANLLKNKKSKVVIVVYLFLITYFNFKILFSDDYYSANVGSKNYDNDAVYFRLQEEISRYIVDDAQGNKFQLERVGLNDEYPGNFSQNYQYIMWWMGNEPVKVGDEIIGNVNEANIKYIIVEEAGSLSEEEIRSAKQVGGVYIIKQGI